MEVLVRKITIRGIDEYIVDIRGGGLPIEKQLDILLEASYNTILTSPEFIEKESLSPEKKEKIIKLREAMEKYLDLEVS